MHLVSSTRVPNRNFRICLNQFRLAAIARLCEQGHIAFGAGDGSKAVLCRRPGVKTNQFSTSRSVDCDRPDARLFRHGVQNHRIATNCCGDHHRPADHCAPDNDTHRSIDRKMRVAGLAHRRSKTAHPAFSMRHHKLPGMARATRHHKEVCPLRQTAKVPYLDRSRVTNPSPAGSSPEELAMAKPVLL